MLFLGRFFDWRFSDSKARVAGNDTMAEISLLLLEGMRSVVASQGRLEDVLRTIVLIICIILLERFRSRRTVLCRRGCKM